MTFHEALGRVLAEEIVAEADDPPAPKSAMDGFALRAAETRGAAPKRPTPFAFDEVVGAGRLPHGKAGEGRAVRIMTGALLPEGADAVVNPLEKDFAARLDELTGGGGFDKVIEAVGGTQTATLPEAVRIVKRNGTVVIMGVFAGEENPIPADEVRRLEIVIKGARGRYAGQFAECLALIDSGKLDISPMLTHRMPLEKAAQGLEMMEEKQDGAIKVILEPNGPSGD